MAGDGAKRAGDDMWNEILAGETDHATLFKKHKGVYGRSYKAAKHCIELMAKPKAYVMPKRPKIAVYFGDTGTGKTYSVKQMAVDGELSMKIFKSHQIKKGWYDGWEPGTQIALFDDFRGSHMDPLDWMALVDGDDPKKPVKGAFITFEPEYIVFTSSDHPINWWKGWYAKDPNNWAQIKRRIDEQGTIWHQQSKGIAADIGTANEDLYKDKIEEKFTDWRPS